MGLSKRFLSLIQATLKRMYWFDNLNLTLVVDTDRWDDSSDEIIIEGKCI